MRTLLEDCERVASLYEWALRDALERAFGPNGWSRRDDPDDSEWPEDARLARRDWRDAINALQSVAAQTR